MSTIRTLAAADKGAFLTPLDLDLGPLPGDAVEVAVEACGVCHSDLSVLRNEWGNSRYPLIPGHEIIGRIVQVGDAVTARAVGERVGIGWNSGSCMACSCCLGGQHNHCPDVESTIIGRPGGFAERVRCHATWAVPVPDKLDSVLAAPLFCAGSTVFEAIRTLGVSPTDRVGVLGIGGLGHLALQLLRAWGCEVVAFTSTPAKAADAKELGAHDVVDLRMPRAMDAYRRRLDLLLVTGSGPLDWRSCLRTLGPRGRVHLVGATPKPLPIHALQLIKGAHALSGSPVGGPASVARLLDFCLRHDIAPWVETFPMSRANEALAYLAEGRPRYRVVLVNDLTNAGGASSVVVKP